MVVPLGPARCEATNFSLRHPRDSCGADRAALLVPRAQSTPSLTTRSVRSQMGLALLHIMGLLSTIVSAAGFQNDREWTTAEIPSLAGKVALVTGGAHLSADAGAG